MKRWITPTPELALGVLVTLGAAPIWAQAPVAIRDVTVISATGAPPLTGATVVIRGGKIEAVGTSREIRVPPGADVIEARGKYLIPGLIDTHAHVASQVGTPSLQLALDVELAHGVTGLRDAAASGRERVILSLRARIDSGALLAPRLYVSGSGTPQNIPRQQASGLTDLVQKLAALGVDGIKLRNLTGAQADTVIDAARAAGLPVYGHTYGITREAGDFTLRAVERGANGVMHILGIGPATALAPRTVDAVDPWLLWLESYLKWLDATDADEERLLRAMLDRRVWLEPTLTTETWVLHDEWYRGRPEARFLWGMPYDSARLGIPAFSERDRALALQAFERMKRFVRRFHDAGGLVLAGSDMAPWPGAGIHEELRLLVVAGLSPMAALQAATRNAARALGWEARTGTIAPGKDADLVLLDANPLADITNTTRIWKVIRAGQVLDRQRLDSMLVVNRQTR